MNEKGETSKTAAPPAAHRKWPFVLTLLINLAIAALTVAAVLGLDAAGAPGWLHVFPLALGLWAAVCAVHLEDKASGMADLGNDPLGRSFPTTIRHWLRARGLRSKRVEWRPAHQQNLPPYVSEALKKVCYNGAEVAANVDGLLWAVAEGDYWESTEPPEYSILAFDSAGQVQASDSFYFWPKGWAVPAGSGLGRKAPLVRKPPPIQRS